MRSADLRKKYIEFFKARGHMEIPSAPLVPENDPSTLFISAGMQPLIQNILGQPHPLGKRLVNSQKAIRLQDIEEVGDTSHTTFFEMLGNWSFGDYFKKEQLPWIFEFLTTILKLPKEKLYVSIFEGTTDVPKDEESVRIWKSLGIPKNHMFFYGADKNWWSRAGEPEKMPPGEPGGPDSEVFYDFGTPHDPKFGKECHPNCQCGRFMEIANSVFMQYEKQKDGSLKELKQKSVDFGGGLERLTAATINNPDVFKIDIFEGIIQMLEKESQKSYEMDKANTRSMRIIADHLRAVSIMIAQGIRPGKQKAEYVLRRLIRRSVYHCHLLGLGLSAGVLPLLCKEYQEYYPEITENWPIISDVITDEGIKFGESLDRGLKKLEKYLSYTKIGGLLAFDLYQTDGFPIELTKEILDKKQIQFTDKDELEFKEAEKAHQNLSRTAATGMFKGGLADNSVQTTRLHTAHHLLLAALQKVVDPAIRQRGSNITGERLRMDFNFSRKVTPEELHKVEKLVNEKIKEDLKVERSEMPREEAQKVGAQMEFGHKYPDRVSVYFVGPRDHYFSAEFCGGPHVTHTGELGTFKILKEESAGSGIRRIYAVV
jgi:alanyl-tRNA synthetase